MPAARARRSGVGAADRFGPGREIAVDPVPRLIEASEWERLKGGLLQRTRALNEFVADAYGQQLIFEAGVVPRRLLETSAASSRRCAACSTRRCRRRRSPGSTWSATRTAGCGCWRTTCGCPRAPVMRWRSARTSSRRSRRRAAAAARRLPGALRAALLAAAPAAVTNRPQCSSPTAPERRLVRAPAPLPRTGAADRHPRRLEARRGRLFARLGREREQVDVLYRRLDEDRLSEPDGTPTALGELLLPALQRGGCAAPTPSAPGSPTTSSTHAYVERMIGFYLGEEPLLRSVPSYDLSEERAGKRRWSGWRNS